MMNPPLPFTLPIHNRCMLFLILFVLLFRSSDSFPSPGMFGLLQLNDHIRPPPLASYARLPLRERWMFVRPVKQFRVNDRIAPSHLWRKRAMMRLGKRALMRLGRRK